MIIEYKEATGEIKWQLNASEKPNNLPNADSGTKVVVSELTPEDLQNKLSTADPADNERAFLVYNPNDDDISVSYEVQE